MSDENLSYDALKRRLEQAEAALAALRRGEVDLVLGRTGPLVVRVKSLVEENERLAREWQTTFDGVKDAILLLGSDLRIRRANRAAEEIFNRPAEAMLGRHCCEAAHGAREPMPECPVLRMRRSLRREKGEIQIGERFFEETSDPLLDADGNLTGAVHIISDITERKRAEEQLAESEKRHRLISSVAADYIFSTSLKDGKLVLNWVAGAFETITGYTMEEYVARGGWRAHLHPDDIAQDDRDMENLRAGQRVATEIRTLAKNGQIRWVRVYAHPVLDERNNLIGIYGAASDITDRKRAEEELRLHRDRLAELSRRLAETREAEQRALGRELHDQFGQMLTALKLTLETAAQQLPETISPKSEQARQIADELLRRVRALSLELRPPMLDDLGLQPALLWLVNHYEQTSGIKMDFKQRGLEGARFDTQIETAAYRIAQEALTNAARHAHAARVRLEVRVEAGRMRIEIEDDGAGFDPQSAGTQSRGLSGMRERAELLGGTFRIESQIGGGTRLFVTLPVEDAP